MLAGWVLVGIASVQHGELLEGSLRIPGRADADGLAALAAREHVAVAYAGYWDAAPLDWKGHGRLAVHPVRMCDDAGLPCAFEYHRVGAWFRPRAGVRSMLVVDRRIPTIAVTVIDPALGRPLRMVHVGQLDVAVYDHDIAAQFGPPARGVQG